MGNNKEQKSNKVQKNFFLSSFEVKEAIEFRLNDMRECRPELSSASYIIESIIMNHLFTNDEEINDILITNLCLDPDNEKNINNTLESLFSLAAVRIERNQKLFDCKSLLYFCCDYASDDSSNIEEPLSSQLLFYLNSIYYRVEFCSRFCIEVNEKAKFKQMVLSFKDMVDSLTNDSSRLCSRILFDLILRCWSMLDDWHITYRFLSLLTTIAFFRNDSLTRTKLFDELHKSVRNTDCKNAEFLSESSLSDLIVDISMKFEHDEKNDNRIMLFANDVSIGALIYNPLYDVFLWTFDPLNPSVHFQFRHVATLKSVLVGLNDYSNSCGRDIAIANNYIYSIATNIELGALMQRGLRKHKLLFLP